MKLALLKPPASALTTETSDFFFQFHVDNLRDFSFDAIRKTIDFYLRDDDRGDFDRTKFPLPEDLYEKASKFDIVVMNEAASRINTGYDQEKQRKQVAKMLQQTYGEDDV